MSICNFQSDGLQVLFRYCSQGMFREVFFVSKAHRKPENCGAKSCKCMISVHRGACCCERSEQQPEIFSTTVSFCCNYIIRNLPRKKHYTLVSIFLIAHIKRIQLAGFSACGGPPRATAALSAVARSYPLVFFM